MQTQGATGGDKGESTRGSGELELCSDLHEGDPGWAPIPEASEVAEEEEAQEVEEEEEAQEVEHTSYEEEHIVEYPFLLWTVMVFCLGTAFGRCTVGR